MAQKEQECPWCKFIRYNVEEPEVIEFDAFASCLKHTIEGDYNRTTVQEVGVFMKAGGMEEYRGKMMIIANEFYAS